ncbi:hydroxyethylthiazole kinase [Mesocricetibacter intestinalis]|uniref:Hydroxyethylthiazole kinase n=1 Tax=Mesocricetibacter intestinalis TaxID=1521930 RepID=A0A4R6VD38_9PAST|nr:hydroxyethylthiazole kinase [Mesocricetibacter intestinalis]TDQ59786.1 hydroxyethylthiazole kinase [Mesocricetibacter intestinalis]
MQFRYLHQVRARNPLVHCITNIVVTQFSANGLLAIGASPFMSTMAEEAEDIQHFAQALLINIGTINRSDVEAMLVAGKAANRVGIPVVLDPVGAGVTEYRRNITRRLLAEIRFSAIRGNAGEMAYLAGVEWQSKGVDAGRGNGDPSEIVHKVARQYHCIGALSGATDFISDGEKIVKIKNGSPLFPQVTGSGCLLGAIIAAYLGVAAANDRFNAVLEACAAYAVAGECAAQGLDRRSGDFALELINQLALLEDSTICARAEVEYV